MFIGFFTQRRMMEINGYEYQIIPKADLRKADLRKADLWGAYLRKANLYGADLQGANLQEAKLPINVVDLNKPVPEHLQKQVATLLVMHADREGTIKGLGEFLNRELVLVYTSGDDDGDDT